jgi:membrane protease YdiL (CAAX protease family)
MKKETGWKIIAAVEIILAGIVIVLDWFIPTVIVLGIIAISLLARREKIAVLGFRKVEKPFRMVLTILLVIAAWQLLQLSLFMPLLNHLTGTRQNLGAFETLKGNTRSLILLLSLSWTLAAFGEEIIYRGYLQKRLCDIFGDNRMGLVLAVGISSILFGLAHTEQGTIGVTLTFLDALVFSGLKLKYQNNLWASILAHGLSNTIGIVAFFFTGPIYGFW